MTDTNTVISSSSSQYQVMLDNYASIVEKTNSQLGLWSNPYGLMVGILTLLMAIGAIVVACLLWKNSKEQREMTKQFFVEQEKLIKEKNKSIEKTQARFQSKFKKLISEYEKRLKMAKGKNEKQIQKAIDELKKEKLSAEAYIRPIVATSPSKTLNTNLDFTPLSSIKKDTVLCSGCGLSFSFCISPQSITSTGNATCPYCGTINKI